MSLIPRPLPALTEACERAVLTEEACGRGLVDVCASSLGLRALAADPSCLVQAASASADRACVSLVLTLRSEL